MIDHPAKLESQINDGECFSVIYPMAYLGIYLLKKNYSVYVSNFNLTVLPDFNLLNLPMLCDLG